MSATGRVLTSVADAGAPSRLTSCAAVTSLNQLCDAAEALRR
jgi:hypothetical protein